MTILYSEEVVQLTQTGLAVEWAAKTEVESAPKFGTVHITQGDDEIVIPWCYIPDIIHVLEEAQDEFKRHRDCGLDLRKRDESLSKSN